MKATASVPEMTARDRATPATVGMVTMAVDAVLSVFAMLRVGARLLALEARLDEIEARPVVKYCGTFTPGRYIENSLVTRAGSLWCATTDTDDVPGEGRTDWLRVVKRGTA